jgi:hypothetical protein
MKREIVAWLQAEGRAAAANVRARVAMATLETPELDSLIEDEEALMIVKCEFVKALNIEGVK